MSSLATKETASPAAESSDLNLSEKATGITLPSLIIFSVDLISTSSEGALLVVFKCSIASNSPPLY